VPLSDEGRQQAGHLARRFSGDDITRLLSSDLSRAVETVQIIGKGRDLKLGTDAAWREMALGELEGCLAADVRRDNPELMKLWRERPSEVQMPGGEAFAALQTRIRGAFDALAEGEAEGEIVVVTHGFAILSLLTHLLGLELDSFRRLWIDPTGISRIERRAGRWVVRSINDTGHLPPSGAR